MNIGAKVLCNCFALRLIFKEMLVKRTRKCCESGPDSTTHAATLQAVFLATSPINLATHCGEIAAKVDFLKVLLIFFFWPRFSGPFKRTFHTCLAPNSPVENSTGDVMAIEQ